MLKNVEEENLYWEVVYRKCSNVVWSFRVGYTVHGS